MSDNTQKKEAPKKETKKEKKVTWNPFGKIKDFCGGLYDTVHQEFEEIENEEA